MTWSDVLLWFAGVSWAFAGFAAIRQAQAGDPSLFRHLAMVAAIALVCWWLVPGALVGVLVGLWLATIVAPQRLYQRALRLLTAGRARAAIAVTRVVGALQPLGPYALAAALLRHQALLDAGNDAAADRLAAQVSRQGGAIPRTVQWRTLAARRQWPELLAATIDHDEPEAVVHRVRACGELGDLAGMAGASAALIALATAHPGQLRVGIAVPLAFGGRASAVREVLRDSPADRRDFWVATARWADGEDVSAREMLAAISAPPGSGLARAVRWRLDHPPVPIASVALDRPDIITAINDLEACAAAPAAPAPARPWLTWAIMAACAAMFALADSYHDYDAALERLGALDTGLDPLANWWRFIAAAFLHGNLVHLAMNLYALWIFGPPWERVQGRWRFATIYVGSAIGSGAMIYAVAAFKQVQSGAVGASGAIMGLIGAQLLIILRHRDPAIPITRHPQVRNMAWIVGMQTAFDLSHPIVSQSGHIGGFISGFLIAWLVVPRAPRPVPG